MSTCPIENPSAQIKDFYSLHHWVRMKQKYGKEIWAWFQPDWRNGEEQSPNTIHDRPNVVSKSVLTQVKSSLYSCTGCDNMARREKWGLRQYGIYAGNLTWHIMKYRRISEVLCPNCSVRQFGPLTSERHQIPCELESIDSSQFGVQLVHGWVGKLRTDFTLYTGEWSKLWICTALGTFQYWWGTIPVAFMNIKYVSFVQRNPVQSSREFDKDNLFPYCIYN